MKRRGHEYLRALFDRLDTGILIADDEGRYVDANAAACKLLQRTRKQILGQRAHDFLESRDIELLESQWRAFLRDGIQSGVVVLQNGNGGWVELEFHAYANFVPGLHCSFLTARQTSEPPEGDFITLCAWTKRVKSGEEWIPVDEYLKRAYGLRVSHGICPEALSQM
jgi:PAS domain S-box-containing protein